MVLSLMSSSPPPAADPRAISGKDPDMGPAFNGTETLDPLGLDLEPFDPADLLATPSKEEDVLDMTEILPPAARLIALSNPFVSTTSPHPAD